jgi:ADP-ribose pyrophosphatase YjhB (NUDIX family)
MRREYPDAPIVTVGLIVRKGDQVLIIQRGKEPSKGRWTIPGGAVELGEALREAGRREIAEECGIDVSVGKVADVFERVVRDGDGRVRYHYVIIDFLADYVSGDIRPATDVDDARWVRKEELGTFDITERARQLLEDILSRPPQT